MNKTDDFLAQLEPYLAQLNMQNLSKVKENQAKANGSINAGSVQQQPNESSDPIGELIQNEDDKQKLQALMDSSSIGDVNAPKTIGTQQTSGPSVSTPQQSVQTVVVDPSAKTDKTTKQTIAAKSSPLTSAVTPDVIAKYTKLYGVPDSNVTKAILTAAKTTGEDLNLLFKFAKAESEFDPKAKAETSSAEGLYQFIDSTWNYVMNKLGGKEKFGLKGNKHDAYENAVAGAIYLNQIKKEMSAVRPSGQFTPGELYLGHFAGAPTAAKAIKLIDQGKGNVSPTTVFTPQQIKANVSIFYPVTYRKNSKGQTYGEPVISGPMRSLSQVVSKLSEKVS